MRTERQKRRRHKCGRSRAKTDRDCFENVEVDCENPDFEHGDVMVRLINSMSCHVVVLLGKRNVAHIEGGRWSIRMQHNGRD